MGYPHAVTSRSTNGAGRSNLRRTAGSWRGGLIAAAASCLTLAACAPGSASAAGNTGWTAGAGASATAGAATAMAPAGQRVAGAPEAPSALKVPDDDAKPVAVLHGVGVQVYTCQSGAWTLLEPAATLFDGQKAVALHTRGPEWVSTVDGSAVTGTAVATVPQKTAVAELLLKATSNRGTATFGKVAYIQRLDTKGGLAPTGTCDSTGQLSVPYTATYVFYAS
jgi:uncharacterized protein DUF3455